MSIEAPIQFDFCEQVNAEYRIYHDEQEEQAAHVDECRHCHQEGHDGRAEGVVARDEEQEAHDAQRLYDCQLRPELLLGE